MTDLDRLLAPFIDSWSRPAARRLWLTLLLGAPLFAFLGFYVHNRTAGPGPQVFLDRDRAIAIAHNLARENGIDASQWTPHLRFEHLPVAARYHELVPAPQGPPPGEAPPPDAGPPPPGPGPARANRSRRFIPDSLVQVVLLRADRRLWVSVDMGPRGFITAYRIGGPALTPPALDPGPEAARAAANHALAEWLGDMAVSRFGAPELSSSEDAASPAARRFTWRSTPRNSPDLELVSTIDVLGARVIGRRVSPVFSQSFLDREINRPRARSETFSTLRVALIVCLVLYTFYRYARRAIEKEAPHRRVLILALLFLAVNVLFLASNPDIAAGDLNPSRLSSSFFLILQLTVTVLASMVLGLALGVAYGAGEGEVREGWPGKLVSLDALLTGRIWSANTGVAVVSGLAFAAWIFCANVVAIAAFTTHSTEDSLATLSFTFGRAPLLQLLLSLPLGALILSVLDLLVPLTFLRRHVSNPFLRVLFLVFCAIVCGGVRSRFEPTSLSFWIDSLAGAAAVLLPFFACDYLAAIVSVTTLSFCLRVSDLVSLSPYWNDRAQLIAFAFAAVALPLAASAWIARRFVDLDVRPTHARNLAERLSLQAELNAARQAQMRLLPDSPPPIPGLSIAASCTPAQEVAGDFYDFYPLPNNRLGLIVAEGGNDGLASALTIALAKGFLMYQSEDAHPIQDEIRLLEEALGHSLSRHGARTSLALFLVDPAASSFSMARTGAYPGFLVLHADGLVSSPHIENLNSGPHLETASLSLLPGDTVLIHTDGLPRLLALRNAGSPEQALRLAAASGRASSPSDLLRAVTAPLLAHRHSLADDITTVALRFDGPLASSLEEVA